MAKKKNKGGGVKQAIRKAGPKISKKELNKIVKTAGSTSAALNKIASVQKSMKKADKVAPSIGSAAANMLIKQAQSTPVGVYQLGSSKLAESIRGMAGTPAGPMIKGQQTPAKPPSGLGYVPGGMVIRPSGRLATGPLKGKNTKTSGASPYDGMMTGEESDPNGPGPWANTNPQTDPEVTTETQVTDEVSPETLSGPGMLSGGGDGFGGATFLGRPKSRFRKLGLNNKGMNALQRMFINYQNSLNS